MERTISYLSGRQAIEAGLITEEHWQQAIAHPWAWVSVDGSRRIRRNRSSLATSASSGTGGNHD